MNLTKRKNNEKLPEIPGKKQTLHRNHGGGVERVTGVCDHNVLLRMAEHESKQDVSGSGQNVCDRTERVTAFQ